MFALRYAMSFVAEGFFSWPSRHCIQALGCENGSFGAWLAWCHSVAYYCATWKHPLRLCWNRRAWEIWMQEDD